MERNELKNELKNFIRSVENFNIGKKSKQINRPKSFYINAIRRLTSQVIQGHWTFYRIIKNKMSFTKCPSNTEIGTSGKLVTFTRHRSSIVAGISYQGSPYSLGNDNLIRAKINYSLSDESEPEFGRTVAMLCGLHL